MSVCNKGVSELKNGMMDQDTDQSSQSGSLYGWEGSKQVIAVDASLERTCSTCLRPKSNSVLQLGFEGGFSQIIGRPKRSIEILVMDQ